ncbi:dihydrofolate reductase family protein [Plantactinospora sp. GCM10030261]|uniref:dihydrofolate reductase family protein n=1 Tax=Plantactinospora sp. GCM10030261 TaxID=3273420 RepID=UPI00360629E8
MRKVVLAMQMSLDGYVAGPASQLDWMWPTFTPEMKADIVEAIRRTSTQLMGRVTYEAQSAHWPDSTDEIAPLVNDAEKIVFSQTLSEPLSWSGARLATADLATVIQRLRRTAGGDIALVGGSVLARAAIGVRLVDEYQLIVHPVTLGEGLPLFDAPVSLHLRDHRIYSSGAMRLTYSS